MALPKLPYKWRIYLHGAVASAINGIGGAFAVAFVDPHDFNPFISGTWASLLSVSAYLAFQGFFTYMKEHPLPNPSKDSDADSVATGAMAAIQTARLGGDPKTGTGGVM